MRMSDAVETEKEELRELVDKANTQVRQRNNTSKVRKWQTRKTPFSMNQKNFWNKKAKVRDNSQKCGKNEDRALVIQSYE